MLLLKTRRLDNRALRATKVLARPTAFLVDAFEVVAGDIVTMRVLGEEMLQCWQCKGYVPEVAIYSGHGLCKLCAEEGC